MRFLCFVILAALAGTTNHSAANEATAFKSFVLGHSSSSLQRQRGVDCNRPLARPLAEDVTGRVKVLAKKMAELNSVQGGDLICKVRSQTIGGQPIVKTVLKLYSDRLLQIELSLKFKPLHRDIRNQYYPSSPEIEQVFDALKGKYGSPGEQRIRHSDCSCYVVTSNWTRPDGATITMERHEESASEAKIVFTAPEYKKAFHDRRAASSHATSEYLEAKRRQGDEARAKNLRDL